MRAKETYCDEVEEMAKAYPFAMVDLDWNKLEFYIRNPEAAKMYNHAAFAHFAAVGAVLCVTEA